MNYRETVSKMMAYGNDMRMLPGDGIVDEMGIMKEGLLPYLSEDYGKKEWFKACATLFRTACKYLCRYTDKECLTLWKEMEEMYERKNADYGNSWEVELGMFGIICMYIRMYEKINRIISVSQNGARVSEESLVDTLTDIANYCVMTGMWIGPEGIHNS